jgi:deoxyribodipyrimidine photolyase-like uncharacterized protein
MRNEPLLKNNVRMALQLKNLTRMTSEQRQAVQARAEAIQNGLVGAE